LQEAYLQETYHINKTHKFGKFLAFLQETYQMYVFY